MPFIWFGKAVLPNHASDGGAGTPNTLNAMRPELMSKSLIPPSSVPNTGSFMTPVVVMMILLWSLSLLSGCDSGDRDGANGNSGKPKIVATTGMIGDMVNQLVGDLADVDVMMGPGIDPHLFDPRREHSKAILYSDIVVYNGLHLEAKLGDRIEQRGKDGRTTIAVGELLPDSTLLKADDLYDPHIWMDIDLWRQATELTAERLVAAMPDHADKINANAEAYTAQLVSLDQWAKESLKSVPNESRVLVTAHDAFQYFGRSYKIEVHGVQGISTLSEAGIQDVNRTVDMIVKRKVPAIFVETSVNDRQVKAIIEGARSRGHDVRPGEPIYSDSMGALDTDEGNYIGMMRHNVTTITTELGGTVADDQESAESDVPPVAAAQL